VGAAEDEGLGDAVGLAVTVGPGVNVGALEYEGAADPVGLAVEVFVANGIIDGLGEGTIVGGPVGAVGVVVGVRVGITKLPTVSAARVSQKLPSSK